MGKLGKIIFWEYPRESWQWWILVLAILAFIFLTPRDFFRDQPRPARIQVLEHGYLLDAKSLENVPEANWSVKATDLIRKYYKNQVTVARVEPVKDDDEVWGYMAVTKP